MAKDTPLENIISEAELRNFEKNKLIQSERHIHDWYRFVLSYPPHLVRQYISDFNLSEKDTVLDPFCGTGTTLVESKILGVKSVGLEANPFAYFAGSTKIDWTIDVRGLESAYKRIAERAYKSLSVAGISDHPSPENLNVCDLLKLESDKESVILRNSISPLPLHKCLVLLDLINKEKNTPYYKYLAIALANSAVFKFSNLKFGPEVGVGKTKQDSVVIGYWVEEISKIVSDLEAAQDMPETEAKVIFADSRTASQHLKPNSVSAVITSPPYPNEKDYTRATRLESVLLGLINNKQELRLLKKGLLRSNTRGVYKGDEDDKYVVNFPEIQRIASEIERKRLELGKTSGFEKLYHKVTKLYFGGMAKHFEELKSVLKPGAQLAYVVGDQASFFRVMIRTGHLLAEIAVSLGYELVRIDLFRTRFSTATQSYLNEEVVILRWPG